MGRNPAGRKSQRRELVGASGLAGGGAEIAARMLEQRRRSDRKPERSPEPTAQTNHQSQDPRPPRLPMAEVRACEPAAERIGVRAGPIPARRSSMAVTAGHLPALLRGIVRRRRSPTSPSRRSGWPVSCGLRIEHDQAVGVGPAVEADPRSHRVADQRLGLLAAVEDDVHAAAAGLAGGRHVGEAGRSPCRARSGRPGTRPGRRRGAGRPAPPTGGASGP